VDHEAAAAEAGALGRRRRECRGTTRIRGGTDGDQYVHNARHPASLVSVTGVLVGMSSAGTDAQSTGLVGTWRLVSAEDRLPGGKIEYPFGSGATGTITYDATGHMAVQIMRPARKLWAAFEAGSGQPLLSYVAYFGTYDVDEATHRVVHHIQGHLDPKRLGVDNVRTYELVGDRLTLIEAERPERHVTWERVRSK
jgi:Lipocalin-like domain